MSTDPARRARLLAIAEVALFLALPFAVLWRVAPGLSRLTLGNDYVVFPFDAQLEIVWAWSRGLVPLYVPGFAGGQSASALTLAQAWHPITWLAAVIPGYGSGHAEVIVTTLRFLELGLTHLALHRATRAAGVGLAPSFALTFAVVFNGRMLDSFRYGSSLEGYCGMLLACAAFAAGWRRGWSPARVAMAAGAVYLTLVSGHPQWALFAVLAAGFFGLFLPLASSQVARPPEARAPLRYVGGLALACALGGVLSAGYVLPFLLEFLAQNAGRVDQSYRFTLGYGDTVRGTFASFVRPLEADVHGAFGGSAIFAVVVASAPVALVARRRPPLAVLLPVAVAAIALTFAMGGATPVHAWMVEHLPLFSSFRVPGRINLWIPPMVLAMGWIVLADADRPELRRPWFRPPVVAAGAALALVGMLVFQGVARDGAAASHAPPFLTEVPTWATTCLLGLFGAAAGSLLLVGPAPRRWATAWAVAVVTTLAATSIALSYGTWTTTRRPMRTLAELDAHHREHLAFVGDPGYGMTSRIVAHAEKEKIDLDRPPGALVDASGAAVDGAVKPRRIHWNEWTFDVAAPAGGRFVLGQPHLPEWRATVDGAPVPVATEDGVFPAVEVPAGEHVVSFRFVSVPTLVGGGLFFGALAAGATAWAVRGRAPRRRRGAALAVALAVIGSSAAVWLRGQSPDLDLAAGAVDGDAGRGALGR